MSDKIYKDSSIPSEYNVVGYTSDAILFFKENDFSNCYQQKFVQNTYIIDYITTMPNYNLLATPYETSDEYVYRADAPMIFQTYLIIFLFVMFGVNVVTRIFHRKGLF